MDSSGSSGHTLKWTLLVCVVFTLILGPFLVFGQRIDAWVTGFLAGHREQRVWVGFLLGGLLATDVFLPVPSSFVSTGLGHLLGFGWGTLAGWLGMNLGCLAGYGFGRVAGEQARKRFLSEEEIAQLRGARERYGDWGLAILRPIPVLAEASVLLAGMSGMSVGRFCWVCVLSNLGVSLAYAGVGAYTADLNSFLLAFVGAVILPGVLLLFARPICKTPVPRTQDPEDPGGR